MELNTDIDIKHLPLREESRQELENALTIINAIPEIDFNNLPEIDFNDLPEIDFNNLPGVDVEGIGYTIKADIAHRGVDSHKLRINKSGASRVKTGVFRGHK